MKLILNKKMLRRCLGEETKTYPYPTAAPLPKSLERTLMERLREGSSDGANIFADDCHYIMVYEDLEDYSYIFPGVLETPFEEIIFEDVKVIEGWYIAQLLLNNESAITYVLKSEYLPPDLKVVLDDVKPW